MRSMLIEDIGQQLAHKPVEWMSWWWGVKWGTFINIDPPLSKEHPLWQREDNNLENIKLFGLPPNKLQEEIATYWEKPFWRRWLLSFFTAIDSKIVIWSYYKRCLSFRIIHKENPTLEQSLMIYEPKQPLVSQLINKLKQDNLLLENHLERYSGNAQWIKKNLSLLLAKHEKKRQQFFLSLLNKHLKELPTTYDQKSVRKKLEEEYQELEKMLRKYIQNSYNPINQQESTLPIEEIEENPNRDLVYVGPTPVIEKKENPDFDSDLSCSMSSINEWLTLKRQTIKELLKEESPPYEVIQSLLEKSLRSLQLLIEPQLTSYESVAKEVRCRRVNHKEALEWSEFLQNRLTYFFRHSGLLFHPDKSDGNENIRIIKTELFKEFQQFAEDSLERLSQGLKTLKRCVPQCEIDFNKMLEEIERDRREFREKFDKKCAEMEVRQAAMKAKLAEAEEAINKLLQMRSNHSYPLEEKVSHDQTTEVQSFFRP